MTRRPVLAAGVTAVGGALCGHWGTWLSPRGPWVQMASVLPALGNVVPRLGFSTERKKEMRCPGFRMFSLFLNFQVYTIDLK